MIHDFSPFLIEFGSGFGIRYYALAYVVGVALTYLWLTRVGGYDRKKIEDYAFIGFLMIVLGGRLGEFLFYHPEWIWNPIQILKIWEGGMSMHGGVITVVLWTMYFVRKQGWDFWKFADALVVPALFGVALSKLGNFMNGELWGKPTDVPWCFVFPNADDLCRHPSVLYQAIGYILVDLGLLVAYFKNRKPGIIAALFLIGYAIARITVEVFWREPDWIFWGITSGTWLSLPMLLAGIYIFLKRR